MRLYYSPNGHDLTCTMPEGFVPCRVVIEDGAGSLVVDLPVESANASVHLDPLFYDNYKATWIAEDESEFEQYFDLSQYPYFTIDQMRAYLKSTKMGTSSITNEEITCKRDHVEALFDDAAGYSFCTRSQREIIYGDGSRSYLLSKAYAFEVVSLTVNGASVGDNEYSIRGLGLLKFKQEVAEDAEIRIHYLHGKTERSDNLALYAMMVCKSVLGTSDVNPRATGQQNDFGFMRFTVAGKDGATGIPEVDAFLSPNHQKGGQGVNRMFVL